MNVGEVGATARLTVVFDQIDWNYWEQLIRRRGVEIDRPKGSDHPRYPGWVYPLDYGFIPGTKASDGSEVDVFRGTGEGGLVAALVVRHDGQEELKLLWQTTESETQLARDFLAGSLPHVKLIRR
jgi:inorganic pyrophosphatase